MRSEREEQLFQLLEEREFLPIAQVSELLHITPATARRLANRLAEHQMARRVHGGVRRIPPDLNPSIPFPLRELWFREEKRLLARRALELVRKDAVLFIHGGSTTFCFGELIADGSVITNSLHLAALLCERFPGEAGPEVIVPGGTLDRKAVILSGSRTERAIAGYRADAVFFSARGLDGEGVLDTSEATVGVARAMIEHAGLVVMLADHSKFHSFGMARMVWWNEVDVLVTCDCEENRRDREAIQRKGVRILTVPCRK